MIITTRVSAKKILDSKSKFSIRKYQDKCFFLFFPRMMSFGYILNSKKIFMSVLTQNYLKEWWASSLCGIDLFHLIYYLVDLTVV